jgi:hypothetical protein
MMKGLGLGVASVSIVATHTGKYAEQRKLLECSKIRRKVISPCI